ncbi:metal ABC transporter solute-binding protein, Zn/Mn family [Kibdelosporangium persicum]|uniref:Periplasmic substrate-binding component of ABC-type metal ion transport system n=1 Tax=Kibdelosporangium persicum TaxID=2698649 RepID=A0ABX2F4B5_9PSEU|nr:zinc ABC transporter substrate-binding protein [Kibdelosporangium persicum]NRN66160.1 Periplasmic substrate-binding component of ABC-type metal ion transport system [Kibdelosporangium persicum]
MSPRLAGSIALTALVLAGCGSEPSPAAPQQSGGKIAVVASTNVWGSVAQAVGGDQVEVKSILNDPSADPHSYSSSATDATALKDAKLAIYNGGGYDDFFTQLVNESGKDARKIVTFEVSGKAEGTNEHVWYDLPTVKKVADKIAEELGAIAPDRKDTFTANARTFDGQLDGLITKAGQIGKTKPGLQVVVTEPVPAYLLEIAGVKDATPEEFSEAIEEETDPPAAAVAQTTDLVRNKQVAALVNNEQTETPVTTQLGDAAKSAGIPIVQVTETLPEGVSGYVDWMTKQVDALSSALTK